VDNEIDEETGQSTRRLRSPGVADNGGEVLKANGYSLQANAKTIEGNQQVDRDAQFNYLNEQATAFTAAGNPVISVDTKKKLRHEVARSE